MSTEQPTLSTACAARLGPTEPWTTTEVGFGVRSLLVQPLDGDSGARWIPHDDITSVEQLGSQHPGFEVVRVALRDGGELSLQLDEATTARFLTALSTSQHAHDAQPVRPAEFDIGTAPLAPPEVLGPEPPEVSPTPGATSASPFGTAGPAAHTAPVDSRPVGAPDDDGAVDAAAWPLAPEPPMSPLVASSVVDGPTAATPPPEVTPTPSSAPEPVAAPVDRRRRLLLALLVVALAAIAVVVFVLVRGGDSAEPATDPTTTAAPDTTAAAPTTAETSDPAPDVAAPSDPADALAIRVAGVDANTTSDPAALYVAFDVTNLAESAVDVYVVDLSIEVGASSWATSLTCASAPLEPGASRIGSYDPVDTAGNAAQLADCSLAGWPVDSQDPAQVAVTAAVAAGSEATSTATVRQVRLADGTELVAP